MYRTLFIAALFIPLAACGNANTAENSQDVIGMANPASVYCTEQGGKSEIRKEENGDVGYCHLSDGRVIEEWEFFRSQKQHQE